MRIAIQLLGYPVFMIANPSWMVEVKGYSNCIHADWSPGMACYKECINSYVQVSLSSCNC